MDWRSPICEEESGPSAYGVFFVGEREALVGSQTVMSTTRKLYFIVLCVPAEMLGYAG